jgi:transcriptional regulator with XRE-family HTH domain
MRSPITGKEMELMYEKREMTFRKEPFTIFFHFYRCQDSKEQFTNTKIDELNINQVYNQYRDKYQIPFPDKIAKIRKQYDLSASKMAAILGFGTNSYRQYETGEIPNASNARLIQMAEHPKNFIELVKSCSALEDKKKSEYIQKAELLIQERKSNHFHFELKEYLLGNLVADKYSGYREPNLEKLTEMIIYFSEKLMPFKTKMNKLLFYADFLMFKESGFSISGIRYKAINLGAVPNNFQSIFDFLVREDKIEIDYISFSQDNIGEQFKVKQNIFFTENLFSEAELQILDKVYNYFKSVNTSKIIERNHLEKAWIENEKSKNTINYKYAFDLNY